MAWPLFTLFDEFMIYSLLLAYFIDENIYIVVIMSWVINDAWIACGEDIDIVYMFLELHLENLLLLNIDKEDTYVMFLEDVV